MPYQIADGTSLTDAVMLANGHVVAFDSGPIQHTYTPGAVVDINPVTGTRRVVLGTANCFGDTLPLCDGKSSAAGQSERCSFYVDSGSIAARGNQVLFNDHNEGQIWLYEGTTARLVINTHDWGATPTW